MTDFLDIGEILRNEVAKKGLTCTEVVEATGLPWTTVNDFMHAKREIGIDKASEIATFLNLQMGYFEAVDGCV